MTQVQPTDARDYAIRKGKVLERFTQEFYTRHKDNSLYRNVLELLIREESRYAYGRYAVGVAELSST